MQLFYRLHTKTAKGMSICFNNIVLKIQMQFFDVIIVLFSDARDQKITIIKYISK